MNRRRSMLVLAIVLVAQWSAAFAHCRLLSDTPPPFGSAICVAHTDGAPAPEPRHTAADGLQCPACHQVPGTGAVGLPPLCGSVSWTADAAPPPVSRAVILPDAAPPYHAHAPPRA